MVTISHGIPGRDQHDAGDERSTVTTYAGSSSSGDPAVVVKDIKTSEIIYTGESKTEAQKATDAFNATTKAPKRTLSDAEVREIVKTSSMSAELAKKIYGNDIPSTVTVNPLISRRQTTKDKLVQVYDPNKFNQGFTDLKQTLYGQPHVKQSELLYDPGRTIVPTPYTGVERVDPDVYKIIDPRRYSKAKVDKYDDYYKYLNALTDEWTEATTEKQAIAGKVKSQEEFLAQHKEKIGGVRYAIEPLVLSAMHLSTLKESESEGRGYEGTRTKLTKTAFGDVDPTDVTGVIKTFAPVVAVKAGALALYSIGGGFALRSGIMGTKGALTLGGTQLTKAGAKGIVKKGLPGAAETFTGKTTQQIAKQWTTQRVGGGLIGASKYVEPIVLSGVGAIGVKDIVSSETPAEAGIKLAEMAIMAPGFIAGYKAPAKLLDIAKIGFKGKSVPKETIVRAEVLKGETQVPLIEIHKGMKGFEKSFEKQMLPSETVQASRAWHATDVNLPKDLLIEGGLKRTKDMPGIYGDPTGVSTHFLRLSPQSGLLSLLKLPGAIVKKGIEVPTKLYEIPKKAITLKQKHKEGLFGEVIDFPSNVAKFVYGRQYITSPNIARFTGKGVKHIPKNILQLDTPKSRTAIKGSQEYMRTKAKPGYAYPSRDVELAFRHKSGGVESEAVFAPKTRFIDISKVKYYTDIHGRRVRITEHVEESMVGKLKVDMSVLKEIKIGKRKPVEYGKIVKKQRETTRDYLRSHNKASYPPIPVITKIRGYSPTQQYKKLSPTYRGDTTKGYNILSLSGIPAVKRRLPTNKSYIQPTASYKPPAGSYDPLTIRYTPPTARYTPPKGKYNLFGGRYDPVGDKYKPIPDTRPPLGTGKRKKRDIRTPNILKIDYGRLELEHFVGGWEQFFKK